MRNIYEIFRVFFLLFLRDKLNLFFSFFFNGFLMVMLGLFVTNSFEQAGQIGVYDDLRSPYSEAFIKALEQQPDMKIVRLTDTAGITAGIKKGTMVAGIKIEKNFELLKGAAAGGLPGNSQLKLYGNSGKQMWIKLLQPGLKTAILNMNAPAAKLYQSINIDVQMIQARNTDYFKFIFPGVLVFSIMGLSFAGAMSLMFYKKADVLKRLKITPLKKYEFLVGFISSYLVLLLLQSLLYILIAWLVFDFTFTGNYLQIAVLISSCGLLFILLGITIANVFPSIDAGNNVIRFLNFPASFLCGVFIPMNALPKALQYFGVVHPLTYFAEAMRNAVNYNASFADNLSSYIVIGGILLGLCIISVVTFKWEDQTQ
jgi:ABC-2 type transport system permease protein